jgi:hypothetical protein
MVPIPPMSLHRHIVRGPEPHPIQVMAALGVQPSGAAQAAVTLGNTDGEIGGLTISDPPTQGEVQALRDKCEELADDVRALATLVNALRGALVSVGVVKGGA